MLKYLRIQNLAIIRDLSLEFKSGLTAITGETGAGKSVVVDSLSLLLGGRAGAERTRAGEKTGSVEAVFDLEDLEELKRFLAEHGWESDDSQLLIRREIASRGRVFIGSHLATLSDLKKVGQKLVDLHGQHEHQTLLRVSEQLPVVDRAGGNQALLAKLERVARELKSVQARLHSRAQDFQEVARRADMLRFQVQEIDSAELKLGEMAALRLERTRLRNHARIQELAMGSLERLYEGEGAVVGALEEVLTASRELTQLGVPLDGTLPRGEEAALALRDLAEALRESSREEEVEAGQLEANENRLALIESLTRKYGVDEEAILAFRDQTSSELAELTSEDNSVEALEAKVLELARSYQKEASSLSAKRQRDAAGLEKAVQGELKDLAMSGTDFRIEFDLKEEEDSPVRCDGIPVAFDATGWDRVQFLVRTNPGEPLRPLARIASGGELSRMMLALHVVLGEAGKSGLRVFDEVDVGVGGRVAEAVGKKLKKLARGRQILCVTHLAQVASQADQHLLIQKRVRNGRSEVSGENLDREGAVREVARMMGGQRISELTLQHAEEMLEKGR